mmetsp:Transcript_88313/g.263391  ORF Transcript_88313/g.263391 Transcript_88313/m.263391 type:complete len:521 (-) Transcript_88313:58-1620(-)
MTVRARCVLEDVTNTVSGAPGKAREDATNTVPEVSGKELEADVPSQPHQASERRLDSIAGSPRGSVAGSRQVPEDVAACAREPRGGVASEGRLAEDVAACAGGLCQLWARYAAEANAALRGCESSAPLCASCAHVVLHKFSRMGPPGFACALLNPPPTMPPSLSRAQPSQQTNAAPGHAQCHEGGAYASAAPVGTMAEALESRWQTTSSHPELCADAALRDVVTRVLQASHEESQGHLPLVESIHASLGRQERDKIMFWLLQVCELRSLPDSVFYMAVLLFDRYCAVSSKQIPEGSLHLTVLAILSIAMKVTGGGDDTRKPWKLRELLAYLCQQQHSVKDVFTEELNLLQALDFEVSAPSAVDFLDALLLPFTQPDRPEAASPVVILAKFLLQLSLLDTAVHYGYPHAVLAAGAVYVALWCTQAKPARVGALLGDAAAATSCARGCSAVEASRAASAAGEGPPPPREALLTLVNGEDPPDSARHFARTSEPRRAADAGASSRHPLQERKGGHTTRILKRL